MKKLPKLIKRFARRSSYARLAAKRVAHQGFTLIELLVVIGILGVLAAALVATIDPFEQINKARDTSKKNIAVEYLNASTRYYTTHNYMPWDVEANVAGCNINGNQGPGQTALNDASFTPCVKALADENELKEGFLSAGELKDVYATYDDTQGQNNIAVCFLPQSVSQQKDPIAKYNRNGTDGTDCKSLGGSTTCYWCAK